MSAFGKRAEGSDYVDVRTRTILRVRENEATLPRDVEIRAGWDACMASVKRPAAQEKIKALLEQGLQTPGDVQDRLGFHLGQLGRSGEN